MIRFDISGVAMESPQTDASSTDNAADNADRTRADSQAEDVTPGESFHAAKATIAQLIDYARYYVSTRLDAARVSARNAAFYALLGIIGSVMLIAVIVTAVVITCVGLAQAVSALLGHHVWLGNLIVGVVLLGVLIGSVFYIKHRFARSSREATAKKYAARRARQRAQFGEDVAQSQQKHGN